MSPDLRAIFINKAIQKHGNKYDYSNSVYVSQHNPVIIICDIHGQFKQSPRNHLRAKDACDKCATETRQIYKRTTEEIIKEAKEIHGDEYDYSKLDYINAKTPVTIICPVHGEFPQIAYNHLRGRGCADCGFIVIASKTRSDTDTFVTKAKEIHGDKYDYSKLTYIDSLTPVTIICPIHEKFSQRASSHLSGSGCPDCGQIVINSKITSDTNTFITKAKQIHGDRYDYSKVKYESCYKEVVIICSIHGEYLQKPGSHLHTQGCDLCRREQMSQLFVKSAIQFIKDAKEVHGDKYNYSYSNYMNYATNVEISCSLHGPFNQLPSNHLRGAGCPLCKNKTEAKLYEALKQIYPTLVTQFKQAWCKNGNTKRCLPFDFCILGHYIIIELDGAQHFRQVRDWKSPEDQFESDKYKEECANKNNYSTIRILQEDVYYDRYDWISELSRHIEDIIKGDEVVNIYLCKNGEYDLFLE